MIEFYKVTQTPKEFEITRDGITFKGTLELQKRNLIALKANIFGNLEIDCDVCAKSFDIMLNENIDLILSDGIYDGDESLDVVEIFTNGNKTIIDLQEILDSEIEIIKSDYYRCSECQDLED